MAKTNGELTMLRKITAIIVIVSALVGPYIFHDRAISKLQADITYIKDQVKEINSVIHRTAVATNKELKDHLNIQ